MAIVEIQENELDERTPQIQEIDESELDKGNSFWDSLKREAPKTVGGIVGGIVGGGTPLGIAAGIAGGAMIGESLEQMREHAVGDENAPKTSGEAAQRIGMAGFTEPAYDLTGQKVMQVAGKVLAPFKKTVTKEATDVMSYFKDKIKPVLLPAEATDSRVLDVLQNVSEASLIGGNKISQFKIARQKVFDDYAEDIIKEFGKQAGPDELGDLFVAAINNKKAIHNEITKPLYQTVDDLIKGTKSKVINKFGSEVLKDGVYVNPNKLKNFASGLKIVADEIGSVEAKNAGDDLVKAVIDMPQELSFEAAKNLRSRLLSRIDEFSVINKKAPAIGKAKKLISILDQSIEDSLRKANPEALDAWRTANKVYKEGQEQFNNTIIRKLIKVAEDTGQGSEFISKRIFKPGNITTVRKVKSALGADSTEWGKMKGFFVNHILKKSTDTNGAIIGNKLLNSISGKTSSFGDEMMKEVFSSEQRESLKMFGEALKLAQTRQGAGEGRMFIQLAQFGAAVGLTTGIATGDVKAGVGSGAGTILLGPAVLSRIMTNPTAVKLLTKGLKLPAGSKEIAGVMSRLTAMVARAGIDYSKKNKTEMPEVMY